MRETLANGKCPICSGTAEIRKNIKGKLYAYCAASCGLIQATGPGAQAYFAAMIQPGEAVAPDTSTAPDEVAGLDNPAGQPEAVPAKPGIFASILNARVI